MTAKEFATISMAIKAAYPNANIMPDDKSKEVWYTMLNDLDYKVCMAALKEIISTNKFAPTIAELRERCATISSPQIKDWGEAWQDVMKAIRFCGMYQEEEAMQRFDEITLKCVKRLGYQNICTSENITADRANFRMIYEQEANRIKTNNQIPISVKQDVMTLTSGILDNLKRLECE